MELSPRARTELRALANGHDVSARVATRARIVLWAAEPGSRDRAVLVGLDEATGEQIASLLDRVNSDGTALVIVTHDAALAGRARRVLTMRDGRMERESAR